MSKKILGISGIGIIIIILVAAAILFSGKIPFQSVLGFAGGGAGIGIKGQMNNTVAYGEPFAVELWVQNSTPIGYVAGSPYNSGWDKTAASYILMYQPQCTIASIDGVRSLVQVQEAYDTNRVNTNVPVLVNGMATYTGGQCANIHDASLMVWNPKEAKPYPMNEKLMKITVGGYAPPGEHELSVAFPCTPVIVNVWAGGYEYITLQDVMNVHPSTMCGFTTRFTINPPTTVSIATAVQTVSNVTGETVTTTYLLTNGSTIDQSVSNSSISAVQAAPVVNDVETYNTTTQVEFKTTTIATSAAIPIVSSTGGTPVAPSPTAMGVATGISSSLLVVGGLAIIIIALVWFNRKRWLK